MRKLCFVFFTTLLFNIDPCIGQPDSGIDPYTAFLKEQKRPAKDYILDLFKTHDIVVICERLHGEIKQYDLLADIISDKRFIENVGNIFTEVGVSTLNPELTIFLHTKNLSPDSITQRILSFQRNCSFWPVWSNLNYSFFLNKIYTVNNGLGDNKAINVYPSDLPFTWIGADSLAMINLKGMMIKRDSIMASQIINRFDEIRNSDQKRKKALVIMNYRHAFNQEFIMQSGFSVKNVTYFLFRQYGNRVANVFLNTVGITANETFELVQGGKWDAAFKLLNKENIGFNFKASPFGKDSFDIWPFKTNFCYQDIFTGFVFFQPVEKHLLVEGIPGFVNPSFRNEVYKRIELISVVNNEFKSKMENLKRALEGENPALNIKDEKKYYQLDSLISKRDHWLK
jgi:hypothetical protein